MTSPKEYQRLLMGWALALTIAIVIILGSRVWNIREDLEATQASLRQELDSLQVQVQALAQASVKEGETLRLRLKTDKPSALKAIYPADQFRLSPDPDTVEVDFEDVEIDFEIERRTMDNVNP